MLDCFSSCKLVKGIGKTLERTLFDFLPSYSTFVATVAC